MIKAAKNITIGKRILRITGKILLWLLGILLLLFLFIWLVIKVPRVQTFLVHKATHYVSDKTNTRVELGKINIGFPKSIILENLFLEDQQHDTLLYTRRLEIDIDMLALLDKKINIDQLELDGLNANLSKGALTNTFNFQFLIDAFASKDPDTLAIKDTSGTAWAISANEITLSNCKFAFKDSVSGMFLQSSLTKIDIDIDDLNLEKQLVHINELLVSGVTVDLLKTLPSVEDTTSEGSGWDQIAIDDLKIERTSFSYKDTYAKTSIYANIVNSKLEDGKISLVNQTVALDRFELTNSNSEILLFKDTLAAPKATDPSPSLPQEKGWTVSAQELVLEDNNFKLDNQLKRSTEGIDYNHIALTGLSAEVEDIYFQGDKIMANVSSFQVQEQSGLGIRSFKGDFAMDATNVSLKNFDLLTNQSRLSNSLVMSYASLSEIATTAQIKCNIARSYISIDEILRIVPSLKSNEIIAQNKSRKINLDLNVSGTTQNLNISKFVLQTADSTYISMDGKIAHITDPEKMYMDLNIREITSGARDLQAMLPAKMLPSSIAIPSFIQISGTHKGTIPDFNSMLDLKSSIGDASLSATVDDLTGTLPQYDVTLHTPSFALGTLLKQTTIGTLVGSVAVKGKGFDKDKAIADIALDIQKIGLQNYNYKNIKLDAHINSGIADLKASIKDTNLAFQMDGKIGFVSSKEFYKVNLNLLGADLYRLGLHEKHMQVSGQLSSDIKGNAKDNINGHAAIRNIVIVKDNQEYKIDSLFVASVNEPNKSSTVVNSTPFSAKFNGNIDLFTVAPTITAHLNKYFAFQSPENSPKKSDTKSQNFSFEFKLNESAIIKEVFLPSLNSYKSVSVVGGFNSDSARLWTRLELPSASYGTNKVNNFTMNLDSNRDSISYEVKAGSFRSGDITLYQTSLHGGISDNIMAINLRIEDSLKTQKLDLKSQLKKAGEYYRYSILPQGLRLEEQTWQVHDNNFIEFGKKHLRIEQFQISNQKQMLAIQSSPDLQDLKVNINNFDLRTLSQIAERNDSIVRGTINGQIDLQKFQTDLRFTSNLDLKNLAYKSSRVGNVSLKADNHTPQRYTVHANVTGMDNDIDISGYYQPSNKGNSLNFSVDVKALQLASFESFSGKQISESSGGMAGKLSISGNKDNPIIEGQLKFIEARTKVAFINEKLYMKDETITISQKGISFKSFTIRDNQDNTAKINGDVYMKAFKDIKFNLDIVSRDFTVLNTTAVNNKLYYGRMILDSDIKLRGTPDLPQIDAIVNISKGSKFTFAVPESQINVDRGDGVVVFLYDKDDMHPIMMRRQTIEETAVLKGLDLNAKIKIHPHTPLKIVIDPYTGDSLVVKGRADMNFGIDPSGKISLSGIYTLSDGEYKAYIEGIMPKEFTLVKGSRIIWNGDPLDAQVDLSARYNVRTSAAELMTIGAAVPIQDSSLLSRPLIFEVYLLMKGELLKPNISFRLDMPENQRAIAGVSIYEKVNELNLNEAELNKQVFSLLVLNKFLPATPTGSGGGASGFARSSVSRLMSDQLNQISSQYLKGVELNFDVQSYNSNQGGKSQANTQLNVGVKKDFNRLSVQVGGNVPLEGSDAQRSNTNNLTGDVQVGYKLTKDGKYKLKAFRQNQVDNVSNGVIAETGAGIIYSRNYNKTKDLFGFLRRKKKKK